VPGQHIVPGHFVPIPPHLPQKPSKKYITLQVLH